MKVFIKNKLVSLRGSSTVKDENQKDVFLVKGKVFSPTNKKYVCDLSGEKLFKVRNKWFNFFVHSAYVFDADGTKIAKVKHPFFAGKRFIVSGYADEIEIDGDFFSLESSIKRNGEAVGKIIRQLTIVKDSFILEAEEEDIPFMIAIVVAIDNIIDKIRK